MSDIEIRLFHYFVVLTEEQRFVRAAARLGITPPTLSRQMKQLEGQVGVKLLERTADRKIVVTEAGQRFLNGARDVLRRLEEAKTVARLAHTGELGRIRLGFMASLTTAGLLTSWLGPFQQAHPAIDIELRNRAPMAQVDAIMRDELDAGFARGPHRYPAGVRGFEIYRQRLALALPSRHPLAQHKAISPAMLADEAFVNTLPEPDLGFFGYTRVIAGIGNFRPRVVERGEDFMMVLTYVNLGRGIAVVPATVTTINFAGVVFRDIATDPVPQTSLAFVYGREPSPSVKLLIRYMRGHAPAKGVAPPLWTPRPKGVPTLVFSREVH